MESKYIAISTILLTACVMLILAIGLVRFAWAQDGDPTLFVSNVHAEQRAGTGLVDITYGVAAPDGNLLTISVTVSMNRTSRIVPASTFTGDVGGGIAPGTGKHIVWDAGADVPNIYGTNYRIRITANDGQAGEETVIGQDDAPMALIPAGEFEMGDSLDGMTWAFPVHTIYLDTFYMDIYEVTNAQYQKFVDATGHAAPIYWNDYRYNAPDQPVMDVSWYDAAAYAEWAGKRLPTEAEWEKAGRGRLVGKRYPWGSEAPDSGGVYRANYHQDNYVGDGYAYTAPVGSFAPNGYGLYDMAGNVSEWCADWYGLRYYAESPYNNPLGPDSGSGVRILRGGTWYDTSGPPIFYLRVANRPANIPTGKHPSLGFRCATRIGMEHSARSARTTLDTRNIRNQPPVVSDIPDQAVVEGETFASIALDDYVSDPDNEYAEMVWTYDGNNLLSITISGDRVATIAIPDPEWSGSEIITFTVTDPDELSSGDSATFTVTPVNDPPVVLDIPDQIVDEGGTFTGISLDDHVSDADNEDSEMIWTYSGNDQLIVSISDDRVATITVPGSEWNGSETITFTAIDPGGLSDGDSATFTVTPVNDPPVISDIPDQTIDEGGTFTSISLDDHVSDADNEDSEINWAYSGTVELVVSISGDRVATITVPDPEWSGSEIITFTATDPDELSSSDSATFTVTPVNDPPVVLDIPDQSVQIGGAFASIALDNYVSDPDSEDVEIVWTYNNNTELSVSISDDRIVNITPPDPCWSGSETIIFTATDPDGESKSDSAIFTVLPPGATHIAPSAITLEIGETQQFAVSAYLPNDKECEIHNLDAVWAVEGGIGNINENGLFTARSAGSGSVKAALKADTSVVAQSDTITVKYPPWDVNSDGIVDISDLMLAGNALGMSGEGLSADVNTDGVVDMVDLIIVAMHYGETTSLAAPSTPRSLSGLHMNILDQWLKAAIVADDGSEVFRLGIVVLERLLNDIVPDTTALLPNYPNPFNPDTWLPYQLSEPSDVSIAIYDATGRLIKRLEMGRKSAGVYRTRTAAAYWDGRNEAGEAVVSGVYFAVLEAGEHQRIRRIVLIK